MNGPSCRICGEKLEQDDISVNECCQYCYYKELMPKEVMALKIEYTEHDEKFLADSFREFIEDLNDHELIEMYHILKDVSDYDYSLADKVDTTDDTFLKYIKRRCENGIRPGQ